MNSETLMVDETSPSSPLKEEEIAAAGQKAKYCLNCGREISGNFCSNCGQSTSVSERISNRAFWRSVLLCFSRLGESFFHTFIKLAYKPWEVIRDYIHGRQIPYSHPVTMLIQLTLVMTFIAFICESFFDVDIFPIQKFEGVWIIKTLKENIIVRLIWFSIPFIGAGYLVYWNYGSRRFSFGEYLIATLYLIISIRILVILAKPIEVIYGQESDAWGIAVGIYLLIGFIYGIKIVTKAFPIKNKWVRIRQLVFLLALSIVFFCFNIIILYFLENLLKGTLDEPWFSNLLYEIF